tara:strand:- start:3014 stop:3256 length:243 start_codon:yes stop_codon:yes gene_type:complete
MLFFNSTIDFNKELPVNYRMRRKKKFLERLDKLSGEWVKIPYAEANEEMMRIYDIMDAELEIASKQEEQKIELMYKKKKR